MRIRNPNELYRFYMVENHWLFMDKHKMLAILNGIRDQVVGSIDIDEAIELIQDITPKELELLKNAYIHKWRSMPDDDDIKTRINRYQERYILTNSN